jgi:hypothetical protein
MLQPVDPHPLADPLAAGHAAEPKLQVWLRAWRERRFASACCRDLLKLHQALLAREPGLAGTALYRQLVMTRSGGDAGAADQLLQRAEESFANWPVTRALGLRDLVHYIAVSEYLATHGGSPWMHANIKRVVDAAIPSRL